MMHKRVSAAAVAVLASASMMVASCSSDGGGGASGSTGNGELNVFFSISSGSPQEAAMQDLVAKFGEQEGVTVNMVTAGATFEDDMKIKMASDDLPDIFSTHGWSVLRYSPYLEPLENEPWASEVKEGLHDIMYDTDGHLYALPLDYDSTGFIVNLQVLEDAGVDASTLTTWDAFDDALDKIKANGISPLVVAGKDTGSGNVANFIASGQFTDEQNEAFKNGTFDADLWQEGVTDRIEQWQKDGMFNADYVSATTDDLARQLADGTAAFGLNFTSSLVTAYEYNPDANLGFIPIPGAEEPFLVGGEGMSAIGVAKNSPNKEIALKFLSFLADPENAKGYLEVNGVNSGLENVTVDLGELQPSFDQYVTPGDIPVKPFFDRVYLPNGMWDSIVTTTDGVITGQLSSADAAQQMLDKYTTLFGQQTD